MDDAYYYGYFLRGFTTGERSTRCSACGHGSAPGTASCERCDERLDTRLRTRVVDDLRRSLRLLPRDSSIPRVKDVEDSAPTLIAQYGES